jgi:hypothetical protein
MSSSTTMLVELSGLPGRRLRRSFPCDRPFDQPQALLDVLGQGDEVRNHGAIDGILVMGRLCDTVACCIPHGCTPALLF